MKPVLIILLSAVVSSVYAQWNVNGNYTVSGNVGIGVLNPTSKLHVAGNISGKDFISVEKDGDYRVALNGQGNGYISARDNQVQEKFLIHTNGNSYFNGGNVGIGLSNPTCLLQIHSSDNPTFSIGKLDQNTNGKATLWFCAGTGTHANGFAIQYSKDANADRLGFIGGAGTENLSILNSGDVGIGVTSPGGKLHVMGSSYIGNENGNAPYRVSIGGSGGNYGSVGYGFKYTTSSFQHTYAVNDYASQLRFNEGGFAFLTAPSGNMGEQVNFTSVMSILQDGRVGVGTTTPMERIHIEGNGRVNIRVGRWASLGETHSGLATIIGTNVKASNEAVHRMEFIESTVDGGKAIKMQYNEGITFHTYLGNVTAGGEFSGYERMRIDNNGNVAIGTTDPRGFKLAVAGNAIAEEVVVKLRANWPDYVFEKDYDLPSLSEVESFIKQNKHLPEVPAADEVEQNGVKLGEMNALLLKKVEELTLYMIQQNETTQALQQSIKEQNDIIKKQNERIVILENQLNKK